MSGFHAFRHSAGSVVYKERRDLKATQKLLGHSNIGTTADIYVHTDTETEIETASALERAIFGNLFLNVLEIENKNKVSAVN